MASFRKLAEKPSPSPAVTPSPLKRKDEELRSVKEFLGMQKKHEEDEGDKEQAEKLKAFEKRNKQMSDDFKRMPKRGE